ncbi:MAG: hypothetical protein QF368_18475 [SAR202 cluster bacterium]|nr:hypothetical protein [SAR202 cluster bacterium]
MRLAANADDSTGLYRTGWEFGNSAVNCLALMNQTYFTRGWGANMSQILEMRQKPDGLEDMLKGVTATGIPSATLEQADRLASSVREMLRDAQLSLAEPSEAQEVFKDFYYFVFEYVGKVISTCDRKDAVAASYAALSLQDLICKLMAQVEHGYFPTELNLSGEYTAPYYAAGFPNLIESASRGDLMTLDAQTRQLDKMMRNWLSNHSVDLNILADNEHLRRFLNHRDPA